MRMINIHVCIGLLATGQPAAAEALKNKMANPQ